MRKDIETWTWKYSRIYGDPVLKDNIYCYATKHMAPNRSIEQVILEMNVVAKALGVHWKVVRQKVELVLYDQKTITTEEQHDKEGRLVPGF
jgi:hypothetical protein